MWYSGFLSLEHYFMWILSYVLAPKREEQIHCAREILSICLSVRFCPRVHDTGSECVMPLIHHYFHSSHRMNSSLYQIFHTVQASYSVCSCLLLEKNWWDWNYWPTDVDLQNGTLGKFQWSLFLPFIVDYIVCLYPPQDDSTDYYLYMGKHRHCGYLGYYCSFFHCHVAFLQL